MLEPRSIGRVASLLMDEADDASLLWFTFSVDPVVADAAVAGNASRWQGLVLLWEDKGGMVAGDKKLLYCGFILFCGQRWMLRKHRLPTVHYCSVCWCPEKEGELLSGGDHPSICGACSYRLAIVK